MEQSDLQRDDSFIEEESFNLQDVIADRKTKLMNKFERQSGQGILPFTNDQYFEQTNSVVRSSLFSASKIKKTHFDEWTDIFSFGSGNIMYRGASLTVDHEQVLARLMVLARGRSLTKPVRVSVTDIRKWLGLSDSGQAYKRVRRILDDLAKGEIRISCKHALARLHDLLTRPDISDNPDGEYFKKFLANRFGEQIREIGASLHDEKSVIDISMRFITNQQHNSRSSRMHISLDPIMCVFFDGVNTTLVPFEILDECDRFGKKLIAFIASHRDGVFPIKLEGYHHFSGSSSDYAVVRRRFKSQMKKRLEQWEQNEWIEPGWEIYRNADGEDVVKGLKCTKKIRMQSELLKIEN